MRLKKSPKHYAFVGLLVIFLLVFVAIVALPLVIQLTAQSWLREQGLQADIDFVGFDLKKGLFLVEQAKGINADNKGFSIDKFLIEVNWKPLLDKQLDIQRIEIEGLALDVVRSGKGLNLAGLDLDKLSQPQQPKNVQPATEPLDWSVRLQQVTLSDIEVCQYVNAKQDPVLTTGKMMDACASLGNITWRGNIGWSAPVENKPTSSGVAIDGNFSIEKLMLANHQRSQVYAALDSVTINALKVNGVEQLATESVQVNNVALLQHSSEANAPYLASWKGLSIIAPVVDLTKQRVTVDAVVLTGFNADVINTKTGITGLPVTEKNKTQPTTDEQEKTATAGPAFSFAVKNITVDGNSAIAFKDNLVEPVFSEKLSAIKLSLNDIDSARPEVKSTISVHVNVSDYGQVDISGTVQPFTERLNIDLKQDIKHIDLANYNVYGKTFIGHSIRSGQLNLEQKLKITDGNLDTESTMTLNKFKVKSLEGKEAEKYKSDLGIPLSTALSLLRDKNDNIKLTIPVTGDINNPDFSLHDVISTVTGKAIREAIINYYTPFGLVKLLGGVVDLATGLNFEPVVFAAGDAKLGQAGKENMNKLSALLSERPQVQLTLCGSPVRDDILQKYKLAELGLKAGEEEKPFNLTDKQVSELLALFKARMDNMKKYMVNQLNVDPGQVLLCSEPDVEWVTGIKTKPEITITI